jgi:hypothetical protein
MSLVKKSIEAPSTLVQMLLVTVRIAITDVIPPRDVVHGEERTVLESDRRRKPLWTNEQIDDRASAGCVTLRSSHREDRTCGR